MTSLTASPSARQPWQERTGGVAPGAVARHAAPSQSAVHACARPSLVKCETNVATKRNAGSRAPVRGKKVQPVPIGGILARLMSRKIWKLGGINILNFPHTVSCAIDFPTAALNVVAKDAPDVFQDDLMFRSKIVNNNCQQAARKVLVRGCGVPLADAGAGCLHAAFVICFTTRHSARVRCASPAEWRPDDGTPSRDQHHRARATRQRTARGALGWRWAARRGKK